MKQRKNNHPTKRREWFNVAMEGGTPFVDEEDFRSECLMFKLANLQVPKKTTLVNGGLGRYFLFGKTNDFRTIEQTNQSNEFEIKLEEVLPTSRGIVVPYVGGENDFKLDNIRGLYLRDGRIFVHQDMIDPQYERAIPRILGEVRNIFDGRYDRFYREMVG